MILHPNDVLGGRNMIAHGHAGTKYFRELIQTYRNDYQIACDRGTKGRVVRHIINIIQQRGGRFLKPIDDVMELRASKPPRPLMAVCRSNSGRVTPDDHQYHDDDSESEWIVLNDAEVYDKVSHALRSARSPGMAVKKNKKKTTSNSMKIPLVDTTASIMPSCPSATTLTISTSSMLPRYPCCDSDNETDDEVIAYHQMKSTNHELPVDNMIGHGIQNSSSEPVLHNKQTMENKLLIDLNNIHHPLSMIVNKHCMDTSNSEKKKGSKYNTDHKESNSFDIGNYCDERILDEDVTFLLDVFTCDDDDNIFAFDSISSTDIEPV